MLLPLILGLIVSAAYCQETDEVLLRTLEVAFIRENLVNLQRVFYPLHDVQPKHVTLQVNSCDFTVKKINFPVQENQAFINCSDYCRNDDVLCSAYAMAAYGLFTFEEGNSHADLSNYISSCGFIDSLVLFDKLSLILFESLTLVKFSRSSFYDTDQGPTLNITLSIETLSALPSEFDIYEALGMLFSWVRVNVINEIAIKSW